MAELRAGASVRPASHSVKRGALLAVLTLASCSFTPARRSSFIDNYAVSTLQGSEEQLHDRLGTVTIVHFWAPWCYACPAELDRLDRLYMHYRAFGLQVLAVALDADPSAVRIETERRRLHFPSFIDATGEAKDRFSVSSMPASYVLDRAGTPIAVSVGGKSPVKQLRGLQDWDSFEWQETLRRLLGLQEPSNQAHSKRKAGG